MKSLCQSKRMVYLNSGGPSNPETANQGNNERPTESLHFNGIPEKMEHIKPELGKIKNMATKMKDKITRGVNIGPQTITLLGERFTITANPDEYGDLILSFTNSNGDPINNINLWLLQNKQ